MTKRKPTPRTYGILGVKKDPKNQILFSFNAREGDEWPSTDEEDVDYNPDSDSDSDSKPTTSRSPPKRRKVSPGKQNSVKKVKPIAKIEPSSSSASKSSHKGTIPVLPPEIWEKIFMLIVRKDGAVPFLLRAERVCQMWKEICGHPNLWERVDMSYSWMKYPQRKLKAFCQSRLSQCKELNVSGCSYMNHNWGVDAIVDNCSNLRTLNLSQCKKLPNGSIEKIVTACKHLEDIDLSSTTSDSVSSQALNCIVDKCGSNLKRIVVASNMMKSVNMFLTSLTQKCPNLEHLDVSNTKFHSGCMVFDVEKFQQCCPKLKTLYMSNVIVRSELPGVQVMEESPGFPHLEELSVANQPYLRHNFIERVTKNATKLKLIDLRGCLASNIVSVLNTIDSPNVEQLYLSRNQAATCTCLGEIIQKWSHSLTDLDLSWNNFSDHILESALFNLSEAESKLVNLDLSGTRLDMEYLRTILQKLTKLESLDISSCRDLDRGCKRNYKTRTEIQQLRKSLKL